MCMYRRFGLSQYSVILLIYPLPNGAMLAFRAHTSR